jgi:hypothetical protein
VAQYVLIELRDPFETNDIAFCRDLSAKLASKGDDVTLFLVQNGVLPARVGSKGDGLSALAQAGTKVLAGTFSLSERGIPHRALVAGVKAAPLDIVIDAMATGGKVVWH